MSDEQSPLSRRSLLMGALLAGGALAVVPASATAATAPVPRGAEAVTVRPRAALAPQPPAGRAAVGVSVNTSILWESPAEQAASLDFLLGLGIRSIRVEIPWRWIEATPGVYDWTISDRVIEPALARGMSILAILNTTPPWAAIGQSTNHNTAPADLAAWSRFVSAAATRHAGKVFGYEVWNEPNGAQFFAPAPDPVAFAALVRAAAPAIRAADPSATIVVGALGPAPEADGFMPALDFFATMLDEGVGDVDAYAYHPYDMANTMSEGAFWDGTAIRQVIGMTELLRAHGQGDKKIWATEYGAPSELGADRQAQLLSTGVNQWFESALAGPIYLHHHRDESAVDSYGLATRTLVPKKAASAVASTLAAGNPARSEASAFAAKLDRALGRPTGPVFRVGNGLGQDYEFGVRFKSGWFTWLSSPTVVGNALRRANLVPTGPFKNGMQDAGAGKARVYTSEHGTWMVYGALLKAWKSNLGFPVEAQRVTSPTSVEQDFVHGRIAWSSTGGTKVTRW